MTCQKGQQVLVLVCCIVGTLALKSWELPKTDLLSYINTELNQDWMMFRKVYNKTYDQEEEIIRRLYWEDTIKFIQDHNLKHDRGETAFTVAENEFADMAEDEFEKIYLRGLILPEVEEEYPKALTEPDPEAPLSLDWRRSGLVSSVKNQGSCGSCWAFAALAALEGQHKKKRGSLPDLSEQNLVDCANRRYGNYGCRGGWMNNAFEYIRRNSGVNSERCYPYTGKDGFCRFRRSCVAAKDRGSRNVGRSEYSLQRSLRAVGPIAIAMDVNHRSFWYYRNGVFHEPRCNKNRPTHAMVVVGYGGGHQGNYWIIKNSWGSGWGQQGYVYASRNKGDTCGISKYASYPKV